MDDDTAPGEHKPLSKEDRPATPEPAWSIPSSDMHVLMNNWASVLASTYAPLPENSLHAQTGDMAIFIDWYCKKQGITELTQKDLEGPAFEIVKVFHPNVIHLQYQMEECHKLLTDKVDDAIIRYNVSKPLPLVGQPRQVTIQADFFFNNDLEYIRYGSKGGRPAFSILKMKAPCYLDVSLEQMVPDQMWIEEECKYNIAAMYGISHCVVRIEVFSLYWYDYMKITVLRRADLNEYIIAERDFKYLYLSDFDDLYLLNLQGQVTIQADFFFNKDLEYLRYGSTRVQTCFVSILEDESVHNILMWVREMVPDQMWIEEECKYDIAAMYGISHWWFQRQRFYIDRHTSEGDRRAVRLICAFKFVRIEVFLLIWSSEPMKKIVLRRADLKEYIIAERDFKHMYPSDFEDLYLLNLQGHLNHLSPEDKKILTTAVNLWTRNLVIRHRVEDFQLGIESYQTQLNLTKPRWEATGFEFKHDYTVIDSPRAVTFRDRYGVQMIMRFNEIHKFSDGTLQQIDEALDYRVKEFQINRTNPGMNTRFWTKKDVDRSKDFMFAIQKRLKTRRIFRNLESFVGGRIREGDYRNPVKEIPLKRNLPDHRSVLTDPEDQAKMEMETPRSSGVNSPPNAHT
ncbi:hypothetical protein Tco_0852168 [Tanacetum coccineum]